MTAAAAMKISALDVRHVVELQIGRINNRLDPIVERLHKWAAWRDEPIQNVAIALYQRSEDAARVGQYDAGLRGPDPASDVFVETVPDRRCAWCRPSAVASSGRTGRRRQADVAAIVATVDDYTGDLRQPDRTFDEFPSATCDNHDHHGRWVARAGRSVLQAYARSGAALRRRGLPARVGLPLAVLSSAETCLQPAIRSRKQSLEEVKSLFR